MTGEGGGVIQLGETREGFSEEGAFRLGLQDLQHREGWEGSPGRGNSFQKGNGVRAGCDGSSHVSPTRLPCSVT